MGIGSWGTFTPNTTVLFGGARGGFSPNNEEEENKPESNGRRILRTILKYCLYAYLVFCGIYTAYKFVNREIELCGKVENKYSVPYTHKGVT